VRPDAHEIAGAPARYHESVRRCDELVRRDDETIHARGGTIFLGHGRPTERAVLLLHGLTASPMQCDGLARRLHQSGDTVLIPRLPGHGAHDRLTTQLRDLRARHLIGAAEDALSMARGLGTSVIVAGFSLGGLLTAWLAQHHHIDHAVAIAPFLGVSCVPRQATSAFASALHALPNMFLWWDPVRRERLMPDHGYPRYPTHAIAEALGIATTLSGLARMTAPVTRRITIVTNASETAVNNAAARELARAWNAHGGDAAQLHSITGLPPSHDVIEPLRPGTHARRAYRTLLPILHSTNAGVVPGAPP
jgi:carboxylesterase